MPCDSQALVPTLSQLRQGLLVVGHMRQLPQAHTCRPRPLHHSLGTGRIGCATRLDAVTAGERVRACIIRAGEGFDWHSVVSGVERVTTRSIPPHPQWPTRSIPPRPEHPALVQ